MELVSTETSSSAVRRSELLSADKTAVSPARSHSAAAATAGSGFVSVVNDTATPRSVKTCACVTSHTSSVSRTRPSHCLLNSSLYTVASASSTDVYMSDKDSASRDSERRRGRFMHFIL